MTCACRPHASIVHMPHHGVQQITACPHGSRSQRIAVLPCAHDLAASASLHYTSLLQAPLFATVSDGLPSLTVQFGDVTPAVAQVADNNGHPELREFVKQRTAGPAQLQIAFVPNARGDGAHASNFVISSGAC